MARNIEISTAHNIVVYFELATLLERILSSLIDLVIMATVALTLSGIVSSMSLPILGYVIGFFIVAFYHLAFEVFNGGQSLGKKILNIKVVNLKGVPPNPQEAFQRWVFRMIDITFSAGALGSLFITSSPKSQRLGDLISGCTVIKKKKTSEISLERILKIQDREREVMYPGVVAFNDKDMLLVKEVLNRFKKIKNKSTRKAVRTLSKKISNSLNLRSDREKHITFLENVLKDYVSLTR